VEHVAWTAPPASRPSGSARTRPGDGGPPYRMRRLLRLAAVPPPRPGLVELPTHHKVRLGRGPRQPYRWSTSTSRPRAGRIAAKPVGRIRCSGNSNDVRARRRANITVNSVRANVAPMQRCGPAENGRYSCGAGFRYSGSVGISAADGTAADRATTRAADG